MSQMTSPVNYPRSARDYHVPQRKGRNTTVSTRLLRVEQRVSRLDAGFAVLVEAVRQLVATVFRGRRVNRVSRSLSPEEAKRFRAEMAEHAVDDESRDEVQR